jgi:hypothetical protein
VILRCTRRALALLGTRAAIVTNQPPSDDDWYLNLLWLDRRKCLLLAHAGTLFPVLAADVRAGDLRPLGPFIVTTIQAELASEGLAADTLGQLDPNTVEVAKTASRTVLGFMNDMASYLQYAVADAGGLYECDPRILNHQLRRRLHSRAAMRRLSNSPRNASRGPSGDRRGHVVATSRARSLRRRRS